MAAPLPLRMREGVLPNQSHLLRMAASLGATAFQTALRDDAAELERRLLRLAAMPPAFEATEVLRDIGVIAEIARRFGLGQVDHAARHVVETMQVGDKVAFAATLRRLERLGNSTLFLLACQHPQ